MLPSPFLTPITKYTPFCPRDQLWTTFNTPLRKFPRLDHLIQLTSSAEIACVVNLKELPNSPVLRWPQTPPRHLVWRRLFQHPAKELNIVPVIGLLLRLYEDQASHHRYDDTLRCHKCGGGSDFGWFYCCTNEAETRLYESIREGNIEHFDKTGERFSKQLQRPMRGPAARADKLSLLKELEPEQLDSLSGPQLAKLLKQRESANATALDDKYGFLAPAVEDRPYLTSEPQECKNTLCPRCGKGAVGEEIAILDLDGILKGDIQPTVAVGYSFRKHGRPIVDAEIVRNIGMRLTPGARMDPSKPAHNTEDDETTLCPRQPLAPSDTFVSTSESNEDLIELYTDNNLSDIFREDDHEAVL
ncbi:hypothetical protein VPNG_00678 [Cytospora leucostoma]|uniref:Uncharacterized protein n=1 Tax=Cytospora leucostoma TaxID=1230097 RepID=A0A423XMA5_9PEZI|nr:hypothetical protein VPNG_00678 [Cytospora leucostoma]